MVHSPLSLSGTASLFMSCDGSYGLIEYANARLLLENFVTASIWSW